MTSDNLETIHVRLIDEPVDVWRPVRARMIGPSTYLIPEDETVPQDEEWEFQPGSTVRVEEMEMSEGLCKIAVKNVS